MAKKYAVRGNLKTAFKANTVFWRSIFSQSPKGWGRNNKRQVAESLEESDQFIQSLNDRFTNPSGKKVETAPSIPVLEEDRVTAD